MDASNCFVCGRESTGMHFGAETCRACGAFFRRTVACRLVYICKNEGRCNVSKEWRNTCKSCRYSRCLQVGMRVDLVQPNRDCTFPIRETPPPSIPQASTSIPSVSSLFSAVINKPQSTDQNLINTMIRAYKDLQEQRKSYMRAFGANTSGIANILSENAQTQVIEIDTFSLEEHVTCFNLELQMFGEMCMKLAPFQQLDSDERWIVFKQFWRNAIALDRAFETVNLLGDRDDKRMIVHNRKAFNIHNVTILDSEDNGRQMGVLEIKRLFGPLLHNTYDALILPMKALKPTIFEFVTMTGLLLFAIQIPGAREHARRVCDVSRSHLMETLHDYFTSNGLLNYGNRLRLIMDVTYAAEKTVVKIKEDMVMAQIFNAWKSDVMLSEIFD